jgi:hypothetical protein
MGRNKEEIPMGMKYNRLTIVKELSPLVYQYTDYTTSLRRVEVKCDCGVIKGIIYNHLKNNSVQSCGCLRSEQLIERHNEYRKSKQD